MKRYQLIVLAFFGLGLFVAPLSAHAATAATTTCAHLQNKGVPYYQCYVDVRIPELTALLDTALSKLQTLNSVDAITKNTLVQQNQAIKSRLIDLQANINAGTDLPTVRAAFQSINPNTRVMLYTSKASLAAFADRRFTLMNLFSASLDKLEEKINALASSGRGVGDARAELANIRNTVSRVNTKVSAALGSLIPLTVDKGDAAVIALNDAARKKAFADMKSVNTDMQKARKDIAVLIDTVRKLAAKPSLSLSITPGKVPAGKAVSIDWKSTNASSCGVSGPTLSDVTGLSGRVKTGALIATSTYTLACKDAGGALVAPLQATVSVIPAPTFCIFDGKRVQNGASVTAYKDATVPAGQQCASETRTCTNAILSGTYKFAKCSVQGEPDKTAPKVGFTAPDGQNVSGPWVVLSATSTDNVGVVSVEFKYRKKQSSSVPVSLATDTTPQSYLFPSDPAGITYSVTWDTTKMEDGPYILYAVARDAAGNTATSQESVKVIGKARFEVDENFKPGTYGDTALTASTQFIRPQNGIQTFLWGGSPYMSSYANYLPYLGKQFDYIWHEQGSLLTPIKVDDYTGLYSFDKKFSSIKAIKALNPKVKVGIYSGHGGTLTPWNHPFPAMSPSDFLHDPSGETILLRYNDPFKEQFMNIASPATRQRLVTFWQNVFAEHPEVDSLFLDGYASYHTDKGFKGADGGVSTPSKQMYGDKVFDEGCKEGPCTTKQYWIDALSAYSTALRQDVTGNRGGDIVYNGINSAPSPQRDPDMFLTKENFNSDWTQWNDGALEEWAHEIYTSTDLFKKYIEVNTAVAANGKKIFFYVQSQHLGGREGDTTPPYPGLVWKNDLALEQFYLASYLLFERNPYTYFFYNPGTFYKITQGIYYYENWNYEYGTPTDAYAVNSSGLYSRNFANGITVVNPTDNPLTYTLPAGKEYRAWKATGGTLVSGTVTIPKKTGIFYFENGKGVSSAQPQSQLASAYAALQSILFTLMNLLTR